MPPCLAGCHRVYVMSVPAGGIPHQRYAPDGEHSQLGVRCHGVASGQAQTTNGMGLSIKMEINTGPMPAAENNALVIGTPITNDFGEPQNVAATVSCHAVLPGDSGIAATGSLWVDRPRGSISAGCAAMLALSASIAGSTLLARDETS